MAEHLNSIPASYFDGQSAKCYQYTVLFGDSLALGKSQSETAFIDYSQLVQHTAPDGMLCLSPRDGAEGIRLYIEDKYLSEADKFRLKDIRTLNSGLSRQGIRHRLKVIAVALGIIGSLALMFTYLIPATADQLTTFIPYSFEQNLGRRIQQNLLSEQAREVCANGSARAAVQKIALALENAGDLDVPLTLQIVDLPMTNALALPGGNVLVTTKLLESLKTEEQLLAVLAHEVGHVKERHSMRIAVRVGASSAMVGFLFGDFAGAGAVVAMGQILLSTSYSRELERDADAGAVQIMQKLGIEPIVLGQVLDMLSSSSVNLPAMLSTHPLTQERIIALNSAGSSEKLTKNSLLSPQEWSHLASGCS